MNFKPVDGDKMLRYAFLLDILYFVLVFFGGLDYLAAVSVYVALLVCLLLSVPALVLSIRVFLPGSDCKSIMRFTALFMSIALVVFTVYMFFMPVGGAAPPILWFYKG